MSEDQELTFLREPTAEEPEPIIGGVVVDLTASGPARDGGSAGAAPTTDAPAQADPAAGSTTQARRRGRPKGSRNRPKPYQEGNDGRRRTRREDRGEIAASAQAMVEAVQALATAAKAQQREVRDLRARLDGVRDLLG
jgi:hypothetical protein